MLRILYISCCICLLAMQAHAQLGNNGALISVKDGAVLSVHEDVVNYNGGEFHNEDTIYLFEDWENIAGNEAFVSLGIGVVKLYGADQRILGTDITRFYDLRLEQTGIKYADLDVYVDGFLRFNDRRFHVDTNTVSVFNSQVFSVENIGDGYLSALGNGGLLRHTESLQSYFYPVGWPTHYRPLELQMSSINLNEMKVRMAFEDATNDGYDRALRAQTICDVIPTFYYRINQISGTDSAQVKIHYDPVVDGVWNTIAHFQNAPEWEDTGVQDSGIDAYTNLDYNKSIAFNTNFAEPAFALATSSPLLTLVADDTTACDGQTVTFTAEAGYTTYHFQVNGVSVQVGPSNTYTASDLVNGDIVSFFAVDAECVYYGSEIVMTVLPLPIPTASSNVPACELGTLELFANGGDTYAWSGPNGFMSSDQNPSISNLTLAAAGTYTVTVTNLFGCSATTTTDVTVLNAPIPSIDSNSPICIGEDINLTSGGGTSYEWSGPNGFTSIDQNPNIVNPSFNFAGTYTVTITDANGCTNSATEDVIINALPTPTATNDSPVCFGEDVTLMAAGGTSYAWSGPDGFTSSDQNPVIVGATTSANGTYTVTVTNSNSCFATAVTLVTVNELPIVTANNDSPTCVGGSFNLTATGGTSYAWSGPNSFTSTNQNPLVNNVTLADAGTYTVIATDNNGCTNTASTNVVINALPVSTASSNSPVCEDDMIDLMATGGDSYAWSGPNGFASAVQNPNISNASLVTTGTYTVTVTDMNGCMSTATVDVIVNALPSSIATNDSPVCFGEDVTLTATGGTSYAWSGPNGFTSSNQNPVIVGATTLANGTYTVTVTDVNTCSATATTDILINELPIVTANNDSPTCIGGVVSLMATGGTSYAWSGPAGFTSSDQNPIINNATLNNAGTYTVIATDNNGCVNTASTDVIINALPVSTASSNSPICENDMIDLMATGGDSYAWSGPNGFISTEQNPSIVNASLAAAGTYTVTVTDANACSDVENIDIIVNPLPTPTASNSGPQCLGVDIQFSASGGDTYVWSGPAGFNSTEQNPLLTNTSANMAGTYTVTVTDVNGCMNTAETSLVIFGPVAETASNSSPVCIGEMVQLNVTGNPAWTYDWSNDNGFTSNGQSPSFLGDEITDSGTYTVTITDGNGCTGTLSTIVVVSPYPEIETTETGPACEFASVQLETTSNENWDYEWSGPNGFEDSISNPLLENVGFEDEGFYTVTVTNPTGCATLDTVFVEVYDDLMATAYGDTLIYEGQSAPLGVSDGVEFIWNPSNSLNCDDCSDVIASPNGTTIYNVLVIDEYGCLDTFNITVLVEKRTDEDLVVPNTITPNGDGKNDTWVIPWLDQFPDNQVVIINRWGDEVFNKKPYNNDFNGKFEGQELPDGTYYYILLLGEDFNPFKGPLTILRE